jgi:hypothetical protein
MIGSCEADVCVFFLALFGFFYFDVATATIESRPIHTFWSLTVRTIPAGSTLFNVAFRNVAVS